MSRTSGKSQKRKLMLRSMAIMLIVLIGTSFYFAWTLTDRVKSRKDRAAYVAEALAKNLEAQISSRVYITRTWDLILNDRAVGVEYTSEELDHISETLFHDYSDLGCIMLAPQGVINYTYPSSPDLMGIDLNNDKDQAESSAYARVNRKVVISNPENQTDGKYGILVKRPIYLTNPATETEYFWGFALVEIITPDIFRTANLNTLANEGYDFEIISSTSKNPYGVITTSTEKGLTDPVSATINLSDDLTWTMNVAEHSGTWMDSRELLTYLISAIAISLLTGLACYQFFSMHSRGKELEILSYRDNLTSLENPRSYHDHLAEVERKKQPYGLIYMDLNDFKHVNDTYGHDAGDELLTIVSKRLRNSIREKDRVFRIGGDEFCVIVHDAHDEKFYESVMARMRENVARSVVLNNNVKLLVSISTGYARYPEDGSNSEEIIQKADDAMYQNKRLYKARRMAGKEEGNAPLKEMRF